MLDVSRLGERQGRLCLLKGPPHGESGIGRGIQEIEEVASFGFWADQNHRNLREFYTSEQCAQGIAHGLRSENVEEHGQNHHPRGQRRGFPIEREVGEKEDTRPQRGQHQPPEFLHGRKRHAGIERVPMVEAGHRVEAEIDDEETTTGKKIADGRGVICE